MSHEMLAGCVPSCFRILRQDRRTHRGGQIRMVLRVETGSSRKDQGEVLESCQNAGGRPVRCRHVNGVGSVCRDDAVWRLGRLSHHTQTGARGGEGLWLDRASSRRRFQEGLGAIDFGICCDFRLNSREGDPIRRHPGLGQDAHSQHRTALRKDPPDTRFRDEIGTPGEEEGSGHQGVQPNPSGLSGNRSRVHKMPFRRLANPRNLSRFEGRTALMDGQIKRA